VILLLGVWLMRRKKAALKIPSALPFERAGAVRRFHLNIMETAVIAGSLILTAALARPRMENSRRIVQGEGVDMIIALDMSGSMAAYDCPADVPSRQFVSGIRRGISPNRLKTAKEEIRKFILKRPNDRIGLIGFADMAYSFVPPTADHKLLLNKLDGLEPGDLGDATGIASPIGTAVKQLQNAPSPRRVLVLFTDGSNTAVNQVTPLEAARAAGELDVIIHTVGIGSDKSFFMDPRSGQIFPMRSDRDEPLLRELAAAAGGNYYAAADAAGMKKVMAEIDQLEKTGNESREFVTYREFAPQLVLAAGALILAALFFSAAGRTTLP
jgi:Ca-activated chloride channel family protein